MRPRVGSRVVLCDGLRSPVPNWVTLARSRGERDVVSPRLTWCRPLRSLACGGARRTVPVVRLPKAGACGAWRLLVVRLLANASVFACWCVPSRMLADAPVRPYFVRCPAVVHVVPCQQIGASCQPVSFRCSRDFELGSSAGRAARDSFVGSLHGRKKEDCCGLCCWRLRRHRHAAVPRSVVSFDTTKRSEETRYGRTGKSRGDPA